MKVIEVLRKLQFSEYEIQNKDGWFFERGFVGDKFDEPTLNAHYYTRTVKSMFVGENNCLYIVTKGE